MFRINRIEFNDIVFIKTTKMIEWKLLYTLLEWNGIILNPTAARFSSKHSTQISMTPYPIKFSHEQQNHIQLIC